MNNLLLIVLLVCTGLICSCKPRIYSFKATPAISSGTDSVSLDWKVRGEPSVLFSQRTVPQPPNDSVHILEFKLIVHKGMIDSFRTIQVPVVGELSIDRVVFQLEPVRQDTLVAEGVKDTVKWQGYRIARVNGMPGRILWVRHDAIQAVVNDTIGSDAWEGNLYAGYWEIKTLLTPEESKDHSLAPERLILTISVHAPKR